jgi:high-affinity iron transporter
MPKTIRQGSMLALLAVYALFVSLTVHASVNDPTQKLLQMLDYIGVDYPPTVSAGNVVDPVEYAEMQEFSGIVVNLLKTMPDADASDEIIASGESIRDGIEQRVDGAQVSELTQSLKTTIIKTYNVVVAPAKAPDMSNNQAVYESHCASCHGVMGYGDGPLANGMEPPPGDFHDISRQRTRSVYDLFNTITLGVQDTPMPSFAQLSEEQRWALALMISRYSTTPEQVERGKKLLAQGVIKNHFTSLSNLTGTSYAMAEEWAQGDGHAPEDGAAVLAYLRNNPEVLEITDNKAIDYSIAMLTTSLEKARAGNIKGSHQAALSAYLDGFELAEAAVVVVDKQLKLKIEKAMITFREAAKRGDVKKLEAVYDDTVALLVEAKTTISESGMTPATAFMGSFIILLREGLEAILVLAAIMAALIKTGRREAVKYMHFGWIAAVLLGILTWWVADNLIAVSGANREITEGVAALVAAVILIYVGFWLHNASHSKRWQQYVEHKIDNAMEGGTLWVLGTVAFIAVYREMFETVLFYQAMWVQIDTGSKSGFFAGILAALGLLVVISVLIFKLGVRLPIKQFFQANAVLLFILAVVFTGQGIAALQEAGIVGTFVVNFPRIEILGIYPTAQSLSLQFIVLLLGVGLMMYHRKTSE